MPDPTPRQSEIDPAQELAAIGQQLAALASMGGDSESIARELGAIRAHLRLLAQDNAEIGARLGVALGLQVPDQG